MKLYIIQVIRKTAEGMKNPRVGVGDALDQILQMVEKMSENLPQLCWRKADPDTEDGQGPDLWKINISYMRNMKGAKRINLETGKKGDLGPGQLKSVGEAVRHLRDIQVDISQSIGSVRDQTLLKTLSNTKLIELILFLLKAMIKH